MKYFLVFTCLLLVNLTKASDKDSTIVYQLPDTVKAVQFMTKFSIQSTSGKKELGVGISTDVVKLFLGQDRNEKEIELEFPRTAKILATGIGTRIEKGEINLVFDWALNENYSLLISTASDSAGNFSVYSGYIFIPKLNKWKLIGTCKIEGSWNTIQSPAFFHTEKSVSAIVSQAWIQRNNGSWKNLNDQTLPNPMINLYGHADSARQRQLDVKIIEDAIAFGKTDVKNNKEGVYYSIMKEGTGRYVSVEDTVVAYYKGYLFANDSVFDQTKEKPATFPLKRLIRGWQIGVPLVKVGGKIKLVIPSDLAYSIRTRSAKIPPNSVLVFEIEVVEVK
jgi:FKBP-type peptidyl-prolyl cis-trans isomerase FkpA